MHIFTSVHNIHADTFEHFQNIMLEQAISRVLFPEAMLGTVRNDDHSSSLDVAIKIERPTRGFRRTTLKLPLFGLAPDGVCIAPIVTGGTGKLLPHHFTLTWWKGLCPSYQAVSFLLHFPSRRRDWTLSSILSCGARTFLPSAQWRSSGHLSCSNITNNFSNILAVCKGALPFIIGHLSSTIDIKIRCDISSFA